MAVKRISVALNADVAEAAAASAAEREEGLSAWLNAAAQERLEGGLAAVKDRESEYGELTGDELAAAGRFWIASVTDATSVHEPARLRHRSPARR